MDEKSIDRRSAIKRGVAAGAAAGIVWSAPKIEGLTLRPSYASAQSGTPDSENFAIGSVAGSADPPATTSKYASIRNICGGSIQVRVRKDWINNPRNVSIQFNPFGANAAGTAPAVTIAPAAIFNGTVMSDT